MNITYSHFSSGGGSNGCCLSNWDDNVISGTLGSLIGIICIRSNWQTQSKTGEGSSGTIGIPSSPTNIAHSTWSSDTDLIILILQVGGRGAGSGSRIGGMVPIVGDNTSGASVILEASWRTAQVFLSTCVLQRNIFEICIMSFIGIRYIFRYFPLDTFRKHY